MSEEYQQQPKPNSQAESLSQAEMIELLQNTIQQLDSIVAQLNRESLENLPSKTTVETLVATTEALAASLQKTEAVSTLTPQAETSQTVATETTTKPSILEEKIEEIFPEEEEEETSWLDRILPSFSSLQTWWDSILAKIRSLLPASLNEKLSDWSLTGILTGIVVILLLTSVLLLPKPAAEVAKTTPETPPEVSEAIEAPLELEAPETPETIAILPPPEPELTPEQSLIAAIQGELASITNQYPEGLVLSIEANFSGSRLIVTIGDTWYQLSGKRQQKLANEILQRSQKLDFRKLEFINSEGKLLARNPVVGKEMVILGYANPNSGYEL
jgi:hypothetical protein